MLLAVLFANPTCNILIERFNGVPAEERLYWRSFLVKLGAENLKSTKHEELLGLLENIEKDRIKRQIRLKPPTEL